MNQRKQREQWLQDVEDRQKNIVFPQTLANETRLWRNLGTRKPTALTWTGLAILAIFALGFIGFLIYSLAREGTLLAGVLCILLLFGPIFGAIAWATRRSLRNLDDSRHKSRTGKY
jgi:hypothetical protein